VPKIDEALVAKANEQAKELLRDLFARSREGDKLFPNGIELIRFKFEVAVGPDARILAEMEVAGPKAPKPGLARIPESVAASSSQAGLCEDLAGMPAWLGEVLAQLAGLHLVQHVANGHASIKNWYAKINRCCGDELGGGELGVVLDPMPAQDPDKAGKRPPEA
jgi:hypothetical protein